MAEPKLHRLKERGYWLVRYPNHPFAKKNGYIYEHRLIMEDHLGRYLTKDEVVHHIDGNGQNNNIENLRLFETRGKHSSFEFTGLRRSDEHKRKISVAQKGRKLSEETLKKMSMAQKGKKHSQEQIEKFRLKMIGHNGPTHNEKAKSRIGLCSKKRVDKMIRDPLTGRFVRMLVT